MRASRSWRARFLRIISLNLPPPLLTRLITQRSIRTVVSPACFVALLFLAAPSALSQTTRPAFAEAGRYFIQNFSASDYGQHNANWAVAQDSSGLIYVGNTNGVLVFDGAGWQLVPATNRSVVRSLAVDESNRVFVGAYGEIGYLEPDSLGVLQYRSLLSHLARGDRSFTNVWQTFTTADGVYFMAPERLIRWSDDGGMDVWPSGTSFHVSFLVRDTLYVRQRGVGLLRMTEAGLVQVPGGDVFQNEDVFALLPYGNGGLLAVTRSMGLQIWDGSSFRRFATEADDFLEKNLIYHGAVLADGTYVLGTERGGAVVMDDSGRVHAILNKTSGIRAQRVTFVFPDRAGGVWLALDSGISRIEMPSPVTKFDDEVGLEGVVEETTRHDGTVYAATSMGVFALSPADGSNGNARFEPVPGIESHCFSLASTEQGLVVGCEDFIYLIRGREARVIQQVGTCFSLLRSTRHPEWVYAGIDGGLALLRLVNGHWVVAGDVAGMSEQIFGIQEDGEGNVWLGTSHQGALRLQFYDDFHRPPRIERFGSQHGLPEGWTNPFRFGDRVLVGTARGLYRYEGGRFVPDSSVGTAFADGSREAFLMDEASDGSVWLYAHPHVVHAFFDESGNFLREELPFDRLTQDQAYDFLAEDDGTLWISRTNGLIRLDPSVTRPHEPPFSAIIRSVVALDENELVRGLGARTIGTASLPFERNSLRFQFGAPTFDAVSATQYQYRLDGVDADWSDWTNEIHKDYTQLHEGSYTFRVRARNAHGVLSREASLAVSILPPWYRAWWVRLLYGLTGVGLVFGLVRWRSHRLEQQKRHLQHLVQERTREIEQQRALLAVQADQLRQHDEMKSRFFSNVSHEFRTPLTLTIGPLDDLDSGVYGPLGAQVGAQVNLALRNARRLLRLINQLLDVARIDSGKMTLDARPGDLSAFLQYVASAFEPLAERREVTFHVRLPDEPVAAKFDPDQLEKVFGNLLSNAFKFTAPGGRLELALETERGADGNVARVSVADTGTGIPADQLKYVFDRFYQADSRTRRPTGSGIGLALASELVEMHGGRIDVVSEEGRGTTFTVTLPMLEKDELTEAHAPRSKGTLRSVEGEIARPEAEPSSDEDVIRDITTDGDDVTTVMVVDDDSDIRAYVRRHLARHYRVVEFESGESALEAVPEIVPDLILCDVMMPGMDGFSFCSTLKADPEHGFIPVVLLTARADREDRLSGWDEGADDYVTKPFDMAELEARVRNLIESRQRLRRQTRPNSSSTPTPIDVVSSDDAYLARVRQAIEEAMGDSAFSVEMLAQAVGQSRVQLYRRINALLDTTPSDLIREIRIARARQLLEARAGTISEVAYGVGFKSVSHFCRCFREATGASPTEYVRHSGV